MITNDLLAYIFDTDLVGQVKLSFAPEVYISIRFINTCWGYFTRKRSLGVR